MNGIKCRGTHRNSKQLSSKKILITSAGELHNDDMKVDRCTSKQLQSELGEKMDKANSQKKGGELQA